MTPRPTGIPGPAHPDAGADPPAATTPDVALACLRAAAALDLADLLRNIAAEASALSGGGEAIAWLERETTEPVNSLRGSEPAREEHLAAWPDGSASLAGSIPIPLLRRLRLELSGAGEPLSASTFAIPLTAGGARAGVLAVGAAPGRPSARPGGPLAGFAAVLDPFLAHALTVAGLRDMTVRDDVADCYNRRHLEDFLSAETERSQRFGKPLSLIFLDLDDLKSVNSAHGHAAGSRALRAVAARMSASIRRIDRLFRFGGDEFCMILPETDLPGALRAAERVRSRVAAAPFDDPELPAALSLSASFGVASFPRHAGDWKAVLSAADAAMRGVKGRGKNAVGVAAGRDGDPAREAGV